ncbi:MAG TPA: periplasmic heavy metal sensor [Thermoanaerobaculia bacterium]|nr:periplasmic heavy metal sensor [Thermoanaerobaculia bacterium]
MKKLALSLLLAAALPLAAQRGPNGPGPNGPGPGGPPGAAAPSPDQILKAVLGLSDAQLAQLHTLLESRRSAAEALRTQADAAGKALQTAVEAATPDPTAVGNALLAVRAVEKQAQAANDAFKAAFAAILTDDQKAKVQQIEAIQTALFAGEALRGLGVF